MVHNELTDEYSAQCWGGPEHGNLISATVKEWRYYQVTYMSLDGPTEKAAETLVVGSYVYRLHTVNGQEGYMWMWQGPGADGDTMERLRRG